MLHVKNSFQPYNIFGCDRFCQSKMALIGNPTGLALFCMFIYCSVILFVIYLSIYLSIHISFYISIYLNCVHVIVSENEWLNRLETSYISIYLSIYISIYLSIYLSILPKVVYGPSSKWYDVSTHDVKFSAETKVEIHGLKKYTNYSMQVKGSDNKNIFSGNFPQALPKEIEHMNFFHQSCTFRKFCIFFQYSGKMRFIFEFLVQSDKKLFLSLLSNFMLYDLYCFWLRKKFLRNVI